ncbi:MAG: NAD(+) diphosphatase [Pseudomonadota bacterium]|nr:NAD(+) diphosphatase [Pseudomonadota bacterium]
MTNQTTPSHAICLFFTGDHIIAESTTLNPLLPYQTTIDALNLKTLTVLYDDALTIINCEFDPAIELLTHQRFPIKHVLAEVEANCQAKILRGLHWLNWDRQSQFCGQCGNRLEKTAETTEKKCPTCHLSFFPRFSPAVTVLIQKNDKILLARSHHFPPGRYGAIAGFIDIGETAEEAAHREVLEEVGLTITDLRYFGTQTWPFPDSFMIAFTAKYVSGEIVLEENEIEDARWFSKDNLPSLPPRSSIVRKLVDSVLLIKD